MHLYDERLSLAPRDIVARAIDNEIKKRGADFVCLDCRHLNKEEFNSTLSNHLQQVYEFGYRPDEGYDSCCSGLSLFMWWYKR